MVSLWLPIIAAAVGVFIASSIIHMVLPYHRTDVRKLPGDKEDLVLDALNRIAVAPGDYAVPHAGGSAGMREPAFIAKATKGPLAFMTLAPGAAPSMGPYLAAWFIYCLVVSAGVAVLTWYITGPTNAPAYVFHVGGAVAFACYGAAADVDLVPPQLGYHGEIAIRQPHLRRRHGRDLRLAVAAMS